MPEGAPRSWNTRCAFVSAKGNGNTPRTKSGGSSKIGQCGSASAERRTRNRRGTRSHISVRTVRLWTLVSAADQSQPETVGQEESRVSEHSSTGRKRRSGVGRSVARDRSSASHSDRAANGIDARFGRSSCTLAPTPGWEPGREERLKTHGGVCVATERGVGAASAGRARDGPRGEPPQILV